MLFGKIVLPIALAMALLAPTLASAQEVNRSLAANPDAVMEELEAMNLTPLSDELAGEIRGEAVSVGLLVAFWRMNAAYNAMDFLGWEIGRTMAINEGYPDPGMHPTWVAIATMTAKIF